MTVAQQKAEKEAQRELRKPDSFQVMGMQAQSWFIDHQKYVVGLLALLAAGGLIAAIVSWVNERADQKASKALGAALQVLDRPVQAAGVPAPPAEAGQPPFESQQAQDEALVKALTEFRQQHSGTQAATTAALPLAKAQYRLGNHDAALASFGEFLKGAPQGEPLRAGALEGQGYVYEAQGKYVEAQQSFEQMSREEAGGYLAGMGDYHRARMLILQDKKQEAADVLAGISEKHPNTAAARQGVERLALLATQGIKPAPKAEAPAAPVPAAAATQEAK